MNNRGQSRKVLLTINNPTEHGISREMIIEIAMRAKPKYLCLAEEIGIEGTPHTHIFILGNSPMRFSTLKNRFPIAHIDFANGTAKENRDYILKEGKWAGTAKAETSVKGSFFEWGELPDPKAEANPRKHKLIEMLKDGKSNAEILDADNYYAYQINKMDEIRQTFLAEEYMNKNRNITVYYFSGPPGVGKTRFIYENHDPSDIYRVTNYGNHNGIRFDGYFSNKVLVFEEFASQIPIEEMLNFLDIYPLKLPARYNDKVACFDTVYITSNIPLSMLYRDLQRVRPDTWKAFLRRIHFVYEFCTDGRIEKLSLNEKKELVPYGDVRKADAA